jgi:hypothetical protein
VHVADACMVCSRAYAAALIDSSASIAEVPSGDLSVGLLFHAVDLCVWHVYEARGKGECLRPARGIMKPRASELAPERATTDRPWQSSQRDLFSMQS